MPSTYRRPHLGHTHRVPPNSSIEPSRRLRVSPVAYDGVVPRDDVLERRGCIRVQPRVQEPQRRLALREKTVVEERDDARRDGARRARAGDPAQPRGEDDVPVRRSRDVGERASGAVECACVLIAELREEGVDSRVLVGRAGEVVGESTGGTRPADLVGEPGCASYRGDAV